MNEDEEAELRTMRNVDGGRPEFAVFILLCSEAHSCRRGNRGYGYKLIGPHVTSLVGALYYP